MGLLNKILSHYDCQTKQWIIAWLKVSKISCYKVELERCKLFELHLCEQGHARDGNGVISEDVSRSTVSATAAGFFTVASLIAEIGSCLVGCISEERTYVANLGDSRAVIGCRNRSNNIVAQQLSEDHNACMEEVRRQLGSAHPDDPNVIAQRQQGIWRVKGISQVLRAIGDAFIKSADLAIGPSFPCFQYISEPLVSPVLSAEPSVYDHTLVVHPDDQFLVFASGGLWDHFTDHEAVDIVHKTPPRGIAKRLVARILSKRCKDLKKVDREIRRREYNDLSLCLLAAEDTPSDFSIIHEITR